jgi:Flp pilus assembly pilin Flp
VQKTQRKVVTMVQKSIEVRTEEGQTMAEYTVVLGLITFVIVTTFALLSDAMNEAFERTLEVVQTTF